MATTGGSNATSSFVGGDPNKENVFYFKFGADAYTLHYPASNTKPCSYNRCLVRLIGTSTFVELTYADVLVFADRDIRPGP
jgi:hypothetical protein